MTIRQFIKKLFVTIIMIGIVLAAVLKEDEPETVEEKKEMLLRRGVAVYDVIEQCSIIGSSDSSIKDVVPANLGIIVEASQIRKVYTNGKTAGKQAGTVQ